MKSIIISNVSYAINEFKIYTHNFAHFVYDIDYQEKRGFVLKAVDGDYLLLSEELYYQNVDDEKIEKIELLLFKKILDIFYDWIML